MKELTDIFQSAGVKADVEELKNLLMAGQDYSKTLEMYFEELTNKQYELIKKVLTSP